MIPFEKVKILHNHGTFDHPGSLVAHLPWSKENDYPSPTKWIQILCYLCLFWADNDEVMTQLNGKFELSTNPTFWIQWNQTSRFIEVHCFG